MKLSSQGFGLLLMLFFLVACDRTSMSSDTNKEFTIEVIRAPLSVEVGQSTVVEVQFQQNGQNIDGASYLWMDESASPIGLGSNSNKGFFVAPSNLEQANISVTASFSGISVSKDVTIDITSPVDVIGDVESLEVTGPTEVTSEHKVILNAAYTVNGLVDSDKAVIWELFSEQTVSWQQIDNRVEFTAPDVFQDTELYFSAQTEDASGLLFDTIVVLTVKPKGISFVNQINTGTGKVDANSQSSHTVKQSTSGQTVHLTAKAEKSGGGGSFSYEWQQLSGTTVNLIDSASQTASFVAPKQPGKLEFKVTATEVSSGKSTSQTQLVEIKPGPFQPQQGAKYQVYNGHGSVSLTAEVNGGTGPFTYKWTQTKGPDATISSVNEKTTEVTPPAVATDTDFQWVVQVTDANGHQVSITHDIQVKATASLSVQIIKPKGCTTNCLVEEGDSVYPAATITGALGRVSVLWESSDVTLTDATTEHPAFVVPNVNAETGIRVNVTVTDGTSTVSDSLLYTAKPVFKLVPHQNQIGSHLATGPGVSTAAPIQVESGKTFKPSIDIHVPPLDNGASLSYRWTVIEPNPKPSDLIIVGDNTAQPIINAPSVSSNTNIKLQATITYTSTEGKVITKTTDTQFQAVPANAPSKPTLALSMAGHESVYSGHVVQPKTTVMNASGPLSYQWTQLSGPTITIADDKTDSPSFTAPSVSGHQDIVIEVEVSDGSAVAKAQMTVTVDPVVAPPKLPLTITASNDATITANQTVKPRVSVGNTFGTLSYSWVETTSSGITLTDANTATPSFIAPSGPATVTLKVTVNDTANGSATDSVTYHVNDALQVTAGPATRTLAEGNTLKLLASVKDADGAVSYAWTIADASTTFLTTKNITNASSANASLDLPNVDANTTINLQVTATDSVNTATATVAVTIQDRHMSVDLGADFDLPPMQTGHLNANVAGGKPPYTYSWTDDTNAVLSSTNDANPSFIAPSLTHEAQLNYNLTVTDSLGNTAKDSIVVTVPALPLLVSAGNDFSVAESLSGVQLYGSVQHANAPVYAWTQISGIDVTPLINANTLNASFTSPAKAAGTSEDLVFELSVTSNGIVKKDQVTVTVQGQPDLSVHVTPALYVNEGQSVSLVGTVIDADSSSPATVQSLTWSQFPTAASPVTLSNSGVTGDVRSLTSTFTAPAFATNNQYVFTFTAQGTGNRVSKTAMVEVLAAPSISAGADLRVRAGQTVNLSATGISIASYQWAQTAGSPTVTLNNADKYNPSFTAPDVTSDTTLTFTVTGTPIAGGAAQQDTINVVVYEPAIVVRPKGATNLSFTEGDPALDITVDFVSSVGNAPVTPTTITWSVTPDMAPAGTFGPLNAATIGINPQVGSAGTYKLDIVAGDTPDHYQAGSQSYTVVIKSGTPTTPPLIDSSKLTAALKSINTDLTSLNGIDKLVSLHAPAITGGTPPYSYRWTPPAKGVVLSGETTDNPTATISKPASECTYIGGDITLTVTDAKGQTVSATLPVKNSRGGDAVNPTPTSPVSCDVCRGPKFICERSHKTAVCGSVAAGNPESLASAEFYKYQYCINDVENLIDGSRYVTRRCATAETVNKELESRAKNPAWLGKLTSVGTDPAVGCQKYNVHDLQDAHFSCSFVCKGKVGGGFDSGGARGCNIETVPAVSNNSIQLSESDYPVPTAPATIPGTGSPGTCPNGIQPAM
ncbi:hypothetical protein I6M54_07660 [Shewanella algae]|uniref:PKD domain-containing protein n=1 Tax=Shewanella algae TaxID=38313 RepID=A0AAD1K819_9GAMM|nr:hypothetical protein [Shewanella algae]MBO2594715.1 hypothetical protein [Shewanella algae]MBO2666071.1 hypothetical protein [Shewanella algae]BCV44513.1 hypothetical protein TUM17379_15310 [Shewanella algae]